MTTRNVLHRIPISFGLAALFTIWPLGAQTERIVVSGFQTPESVLHDPDLDLYLLSNVGAGNPAALDHNGFISRVSPDGTILELRWIQDGVKGVTLNGPKGIWLHGREMYVADVDTLRVFNRFTGLPIRNIEFPNPFAPNSLFLNDVVVDDYGNAFVSDNRNGAIFIADPQGRASLWAAGASLGGPNGLLLDHGNLTWVTFFAGQVRRVTRSGKMITDAILPAADVSAIGLPPGALFLDGYCSYNGSLLATSWVTGKVYRIRRTGMELETVAQFVSALENPARPDGPADISVDQERNRLLVPLFNAGQLVIIPLED
jgi:sugar lactone lactonase YvrE